ncbi:zf-HC2 domain-containing protein [Saccharothrix sp. HUAS TT1]|uniref:zf-HC2 domain-containing protein n=1 Tax=unclassified Saccharothrix TaxID=2593673 RepID=UPI00345BB000
MDCRSCREALSARLDGEVEPVPAAETDAHLAQCPACTRRQAGAQALTRSIRVRPAGPGPEFVDAVPAAAPPRHTALAPGLDPAAVAPSSNCGSPWPSCSPGPPATTPTAAPSPSTGATARRPAVRNPGRPRRLSRGWPTRSRCARRCGPKARGRRLAGPPGTRPRRAQAEAGLNQDTACALPVPLVVDAARAGHTRVGERLPAAW